MPEVFLCVNVLLRFAAIFSSRESNLKNFNNQSIEFINGFSYILIIENSRD